MMAMSIAAANGRLAASQRSAAPAPAKPSPAPAPAPVSKQASGSSVRPAEGKKGEVPEATHKLQKMLAEQEKSARKMKRAGRSAASDSDSSDDDY
jgi:hypothetical protein